MCALTKQRRPFFFVLFLTFGAVTLIPRSRSPHISRKELTTLATSPQNESSLNASLTAIPAERRFAENASEQNDRLQLYSIAKLVSRDAIRQAPTQYCPRESADEWGNCDWQQPGRRGSSGTSNFLEILSINKEVLIDRGRNTPIRSMFATFIQPVGGGVCSSFTLQAARGGFASSTIARIVHRTFSPRMLAAMMCMILFNLSHCEFFFQNMSPQQLVETSSVTQEATAPCRLPLPVLCTIYETFFQLHLRSSGVEESG